MKVRIESLQKRVIKMGKESKPSDSKVRDFGEESDDLGLSLPAVKTIYEFKERLEKLQNLYAREVRR